MLKKISMKRNLIIIIFLHQKNLSKKITELSLIEYTPIEFSKIYLDYKDFVNFKNKLTNFKKINEKKTK